MSRRNEDKFNLTETQINNLKKINLKLKTKIKRIKKVHNIDVEVPVKTTFKNRKEFTQYLKETKEILKPTSLAYKKLPSGNSVSQSSLKELKKEVERINAAYRERQIKIVNLAKKNLSKEVADMIERDIEQTNIQEKKRLTSGKFDDLKELNVDKIINNLDSQEKLDNVIENIKTNDFYDLVVRDNTYRENYIKAIYKQFGDNTETEKLVGLIKDLSLDGFLLSYYNPYSNTEINDIYDDEQNEDYLDYLISYFTLLNKKHKVTPSKS